MCSEIAAALQAFASQYTLKAYESCWWLTVRRKPPPLESTGFAFQLQVHNDATYESWKNKMVSSKVSTGCSELRCLIYKSILIPKRLHNAHANNDDIKTSRDFHWG